MSFLHFNICLLLLLLLRPSLSVLDLAVVIPTAPGETARRCGIRDSWMWQLKGYEGADSKRSIKLYFIIGDSTELNSDQKATLEEERKQYGIFTSWGTNEASTPSLMSDDIRELKGFHDRYGRLGQKVLEIFKVCSDIFGEYRLLLKSDTDSYVHVDRLVAVLEEKKAFDLPRVHAGTFWHSSPILQQSLKDSTGLKEYPLNARGAGYILSRDLVEFMASTQIPFKYMEAEDAMIGTILAPYEYRRIGFNVCPSWPQCGCAISCAYDIDGTAKETYQVDHYNTFETLRWKQRRYEMFGDSCWRMGSPQESSCRRATLPGRDNEKFYFDAITTDMIPDGVVVPDHTSTRDGVCKISFQWKADGWSECSKECGGGVRTRCIKCSGPNGHAYDDVECDANTRPLEEEPCNDHPCPEGVFLGVSARVKESVSSWLASPSGPPLFAFFIISLVVVSAFGGLCWIRSRTAAGPVSTGAPWE